MRQRQALKMITSSFTVHPAVALLGPRQCGKTTLAKQYIKTLSSQEVHFFDLENPTDLTLFDQPKILLSNLQGLIVIDEVQRKPDLFPLLRVLIDDTSLKQQFLILGSASQELIKQSSETLAGRIEYIELTPFSILETNDTEKLWIRGGFPKSYLAENSDSSHRWRTNYIRNFLERDIPQLGINVPSQTMYKLWMMLCHSHGNYLNASELGKSLGLSHTTIKKYIDILTGTFMVRQLQPWFENIKKRQIKSPKIYIRDTGILHNLLDVGESIHLHPKVGSSWEGFAIESILAVHPTQTHQAYFWATQSEAEIDLVLITPSKRIGFECKYTDTPSMTRSITSAINTLHLDKVFIIYPGNKHYDISDKVSVSGLETYCKSNLNPHE